MKAPPLLLVGPERACRFFAQSSGLTNWKHMEGPGTIMGIPPGNYRVVFAGAWPYTKALDLLRERGWGEMAQGASLEAWQ